MATPNLGQPNLSQNAMAATPNVIPVMQQVISPLGQNAMQIPTIGSLPAGPNAMAAPNGAQWTSQEAAWMP
eukprot:3604926-Rhodomonas_salina.1